MCGCASEHVGYMCGSGACHCHEAPIPKGYKRTTFADAIADAQAEEIYMTISFTPITRGKAAEILKMVTAAAGLMSYSVYINDEPDEENEE
jgi:hypothetical protein